MNLPNHTMNDLFAQLGLPNEDADIQDFVASHRPLPGGRLLDAAPFWTEAQARFLRNEVREDADWAQLVDELNLMLHA